VIKLLKSQKSLLIFFNIISCFMLFVFALIIFQQAKKSENYDAWVVHSYDILSIVNRIDNGAFKIESAYRGYLLTGAQELLQPVSEINQYVFQDFDDLQDLVNNDPEQVKAVIRIRDIFSDLSSRQDFHRQVYQQLGARGLMNSDILAAKHIMNEFQNELTKFDDIELQNLNRRVEQEKNENAYHTSTILICATISIVVLVLANGLIMLLMSSAARSAERLHDVEELYLLMIDNMSDGLFDYNAKTQKVTYSPSYRRQLGYTEAELPNSIDKVRLELIHPEDQAYMWQSVLDYIEKRTPSYSVTYRIKRKDNSWLWVLSRGMAVWDEKGAFIRLVGVHTDITAQKQQEEALRELNTEMESFTYIASHDLRSPLVNMKGFAKEVETSIDRVRQLATENEVGKMMEILEKDIPESLNFINSAVERMDNLTNAILSLSRIGRRVYKPMHIDVREIITRCLNTLNYEISNANATTHIGELPDIFTDPIAMEQILSNLLENAVKYLDPSRPGIITIAGYAGNRETIYAVQDNGRGIPPNEDDKIFSIFRRGNNSGNIRGAGMGLAFVKATIRKMGGKIWYESVPDVGTTFYVSLPDGEQGVTHATL
jgi:PAS domain S-box-containing protein